MDEVDSGVEMHAEVVVLVVFSWDVQREGHMLLRMLDMDILAGSQDGLDSMFCMGRGLLLSVSRLSAASRFPMKMDLRVVWSSYTHSMSSGKTSWGGRVLNPGWVGLTPG